MYLLSFEIYKTMNLLLPLHKLFTNQMRTKLQEKCRARENYICLERTLAEQEKKLAEQEAELADKDKIIKNLKKQLAEIQSAE